MDAAEVVQALGVWRGASLVAGSGQDPPATTGADAVAAERQVEAARRLAVGLIAEPGAPVRPASAPGKRPPVAALERLAEGLLA